MLIGDSMAVLSRSVYVLAIIDVLIVTFVSFISSLTWFSQWILEKSLFVFPAGQGAKDNELDELAFQMSIQIVAFFDEVIFLLMQKQY